MNSTVSVFFAILTLTFLLSLLTAAPEPAYANCFSDPPRGVAAGHRNSVASGSAKLCSTNWHCAAGESSADRCYVRDEEGKFLLDAEGRKIRISWIFDEKSRDYRPRNSGDDVPVAQGCRQISAEPFGGGDRVSFACDSVKQSAPSLAPIYRLAPTQDPSSPLYQGPPRRYQPSPRP